MPTPSPRNSIRIARGTYSDLNASVADIGDGELCYATDQDKFYSKGGGVLVEVGKGTAINNNVLTNVVPVFTVTVETTERTITAGAFDLATGNNWTCGAIAVPNPTNAVASTSGLIRLTAAPTSWAANFKHPGGTTIAPTSFPAIVPFYVESSSVILLGNPVEGIA